MPPQKGSAAGEGFPPQVSPALVRSRADSSLYRKLAVASGSADNLKPTAQHANWHRWDIRSGQDARCAFRPEVDIESSTGLVGCADQASAKQIGEGGVLNRANDLPAIEAERCKHLNKMERPEVVDVLDWIIKKEGTERGPGASQMDRQQECQSRRAPLTTAEHKLRVQAISDP
ncbi:hypothetical protein [Devosia faecipullorum]|uniref:hypothetical protein n=1 Tax=Devosia faecipullorum TaxID=2755039 RepID=UPI00187B2E42|nr:hypothetical protein [Devosia faecipullorum]MBE7733268.1 hypothetical protein [Devosia faecipullorum]